MFAQAPGGSGIAPGELKFLGGMMGLGIAGGLCGIGQGKAVAGAAEAMARNPGAAANIRFALILGLVFIETLTIYALFIILKG
ncbi:MAG: ATP synthase F0 subunit C [Acidobacteriia bacterium]|nr:ATP synthase F0 subunit C [Terriglobia bacterium]